MDKLAAEDQAITQGVHIDIGRVPAADGSS